MRAVEGQTGACPCPARHASPVVESAVVGFVDPVRGECPLTFAVLKGKGTKEMNDAQVEGLKKEI